MRKSDIDFITRVCHYPSLDWVTANIASFRQLQNADQNIAGMVSEILASVKSMLGKDISARKVADRISGDTRLSAYKRFDYAPNKVADTASCIALAVSAWLVEKLQSVRSTDIAMNLFGRAADIDSAYYDSHDFMSILEDYDDEAETFINDFMDSDEDAFGEEIKEEDDSPKETYTNKYNNNFEVGSNPIILQDAKIEKIEINGTEELHSKITKMVKEKVGTPLQHTRDEKFAHAIKVLEASKEFQNKSDYAWVFRALIKNDIIPEETSTPDFMKTMNDNGAKKLPASPTSINRFLAAIDNDDKVGEFTFTDTIDSTEIQRRNNVLKIFIAAYNKF